MATVGFGLIISAILLAILHSIITRNEGNIMVAERENEGEATYSRWREFWRRLTSGVYLTDLKILIGILFVYVILVLGTYVALSINLQTADQSKPFLISYGVATGSDPLDFRDDFKDHAILFGWILFIRLLSWLLIPVIAAASLDAVYRINEERKARGQRALQAIFRSMGQAKGLTGPELDDYVKQAYTSIREAADKNAKIK